MDWLTGEQDKDMPNPNLQDAGSLAGQTASLLRKNTLISVVQGQSQGNDEFTPGCVDFEEARKAQIHMRK